MNSEFEHTVKKPENKLWLFYITFGFVFIFNHVNSSILEQV